MHVHCYQLCYLHYNTHANFLSLNLWPHTCFCFCCTVPQLARKTYSPESTDSIIKCVQFPNCSGFICTTRLSYKMLGKDQEVRKRAFLHITYYLIIPIPIVLFSFFDTYTYSQFLIPHFSYFLLLFHAHFSTQATSCPLLNCLPSHVMANGSNSKYVVLDSKCGTECQHQD